jgi:hypothetical protein
MGKLKSKIMLFSRNILKPREEIQENVENVERVSSGVDKQAYKESGNSCHLRDMRDFSRKN